MPPTGGLAEFMSAPSWQDFRTVFGGSACWDEYPWVERRRERDRYRERASEREGEKARENENERDRERKVR